MTHSPPTPIRMCIAACLALAVVAALAEATGTPTRAQDDPPGRYIDLVFPSAERTNAVKYGSAIDKPTGRAVDLRLDIYEPAGDTAERRPVFVFLFGGGFVAGDREREPRVYCEQMARRGYVAVAIDYRINQGNIVSDGIPAAVSDARQALRWLRQNAEQHRLDVDRIVIGGSSAGSITSLFLAYTELERQPGDETSDVAAVMDLWGGLYSEVHQMEVGEPPLVIIHGTNDAIVPYGEAEKLRDRAREVDLPHLFHPLQGLAHAPYMPVELMAVVAPFLHAQLWPATSAPSPTPLPTDEPTATAMPTATSTGVPPSITPPPTSTPVPMPTVVPVWQVYLPALRRD
jgi:acetyl esterase/lipase